MPAQGTTSSKHRWFVTILLAMVVLAVAAGLALSRQRDAGTGLGASPDTGTAASPSTVVEPSPSEPGPSAPEQSAPEAVTTRKVTNPAPSRTSAPAGPAIAHFSVTAKPSCPSGTDQVRQEGRPVVLEWKVTGAESTTLSVDGPGKYGDYGTTGSVTLNFPCSGDPGTYQTHTYTLTAIGPDGTRSKKLTVKAEVNEIATT